MFADNHAAFEKPLLPGDSLLRVENNIGTVGAASVLDIEHVSWTMDALDCSVGVELPLLPVLSILVVHVDILRRRAPSVSTAKDVNGSCGRRSGVDDGRLASSLVEDVSTCALGFAPTEVGLAVAPANRPILPVNAGREVGHVLAGAFGSSGGAHAVPDLAVLSPLAGYFADSARLGARSFVHDIDARLLSQAPVLIRLVVASAHFIHLGVVATEALSSAAPGGSDQSMGLCERLAIAAKCRRAGLTG